MAGKLVEKGGIIGNELQQRTAKTAKKWTEILERISATVQTLAQQNFFLRSHRELLLNIQIQKILEHVWPPYERALGPGFGKAWLLPHFTSDIKNEITQELISLLTARVGQTSVISSIQKAKHYGIISDMTLYGTYVEQMSKIVRFVEIQRHRAEIK